MTAFAARNLSVLAYAQGFTLWHYRANRHTLAGSLIGPMPVARALAPGFFDPAADLLEDGDMMLLSAEDGGALLSIGVTSAGVRATLLAPSGPAGEGAA